jgi:hypothetical protein
MGKEPVMSQIQESLCSTSATRRFLAALLFTAAKRVGNKVSVAEPCNHLSFQNSARAPLPTSTVVEAVNRACTASSGLDGMADHARDGSMHASHS